MLYFISYVRTTPGGIHNHHDFKNTFKTLDSPPTQKVIQDLEKELAGKGESITVISFQEVATQ